MNFGLEAKVGIFVILTITLLLGMGIVFGKVNFSTDKGYNVEFEITDASGVDKNVSVFYRGVKVGSLVMVTLNGSKLVAILNIHSNFLIPDNVRFNIRQNGFIGEKFIDLTAPKGESPATSYLQAGKIYQGDQVIVSMDDIMQKIDVVADRVGILVGSLNDVFARDETVDALNEIVQSIKKITANVDRIVATNEKNVDNSLENIAKLTQSLKNFSASVDNITRKNEKNIDETLDNIAKISKDLENIVKDINDGKGTLGMLVNDNQTKNDIKEVVKGAKDFVSKADKFKLYLSFGADYIFDSKNSDSREYGFLKLKTGPNIYYLLGVSDRSRSDVVTTETTTTYTDDQGNSQTLTMKEDKKKSSAMGFNLQYGYVFNNIIGMRVGIFENTLGIGADYYPFKNDDLTLSFDLYDFQSFDNFNVYSRAYIKYSFFKNFYVQATGYDLFGYDKFKFSLGGGVQFLDDDLKYFAGSVAGMAK